MKYTKYGIAFGLVIVMTGVIATILYGYRPAPTRLMKPSFFDSADQIGAVTLKRFYAPLADEKIVILGIPTNRDWSTDVVEGFVTAAMQNSRAFTKIVVEKNLSSELKAAVAKQLPSMTEVNSNSETMAELTDIVLAAQASGERLLVIVPNIYSTHLLPGNPIARLEKNLFPDASERSKPQSLFSVSVSSLALEAAQEKELDPICIGTELDRAGTANFGCTVLQAGRYFYRKRILDNEPNARSRFVAIMQSPKPNDIMLMIREPGKN